VRVSQTGPFSPTVAVDQDEFWFTLKDSGKTQVVMAKPAFRTLTVLATAPARMVFGPVTLAHRSSLDSGSAHAHAMVMCAADGSATVGVGRTPIAPGGSCVISPPSKETM